MSVSEQTKVEQPKGAHSGVEQAAGETYQPDPSKALAVHETAGMALGAQAKALVEARYVIAMRQRRDIDVVRPRLLKECRRPGFAESALYAIQRGGKTIEGPSIRFAEAAIREMGNVVVDTVTVYDDDEKRIVRVTVTDLEANLSYGLDVNVRKAVERRYTKQGDTILRQRLNSQGVPVYLIEASEGDLVIAQAAAVSKAIRTNGLRLVPGWLVEEALDEVRKTLKERDAKDPDAARKRVFDGFAELGVEADRLKAFLGHSGQPTPADLNLLRGLFAAIRDGEVTLAEFEDALDDREKGGGAAALRARLAKATEEAKARTGASGPGDKTPPAKAAGTKP